MKQRESLYMNTKEAAENWKVTDRTVRGWCQDGWVASAILDEQKRVWLIGSDALPPLKFSDNKQQHHNDRLALILKAFDERKTIPPAKMHYDENEMLELFQELQKLGFIEKRKIKKDDIFNNYKLTKSGGDYLMERKGLRQIATDLCPIIAAFAEGTTKAILNQKQY